MQIPKSLLLYFTFIPMGKLIMNYARSLGMHPRIKCDHTIAPEVEKLNGVRSVA